MPFRNLLTAPGPHPQPQDTTKIHVDGASLRISKPSCDEESVDPAETDSATADTEEDSEGGQGLLHRQLEVEFVNMN